MQQSEPNIFICTSSVNCYYFNAMYFNAMTSNAPVDFKHQVHFARLISGFRLISREKPEVYKETSGVISHNHVIKAWILLLYIPCGMFCLYKPSALKLEYIRYTHSQGMFGSNFDQRRNINTNTTIPITKAQYKRSSCWMLFKTFFLGDVWSLYCGVIIYFCTKNISYKP